MPKLITYKDAKTKNSCYIIEDNITGVIYNPLDFSCPASLCDVKKGRKQEGNVLMYVIH